MIVDFVFLNSVYETSTLINLVSKINVDMKWTPSAVVFLITWVTCLPPLLILAVINYCRSYITIKLLTMPDHGHFHRIRCAIALVVVPAFMIASVCIILHEMEASTIVIDHTILIMEIISINASAHCLIQIGVRYFDSLCTIEQSYRLLKMIKLFLRLSGIVYTILWCLLYLLPVILQNNNYMVLMGMILCWFIAIICIAIGFASFKLRSVVSLALETVRVE